jgi:polysaccharide biosynthesis/export protein
MSSTHLSRIRRAACLLGAAAVAVLSGCETDAWLGDPSVVGRWENTPVEVPILTRIAAIEGPEDKQFEVTDPTAADLIPEIDEYRVGPGDQLAIVVWDIPVADQPSNYQVIVDSRGTMRIPQLGEIFVAGRTPDEVKDAVVEAMTPYVTNGLASVDILTPRQDSFTVVGAVPAPGQYFLPEADYRVMDAMAAAGWFLEATTSEILVIRQIPLTDAAAGAPDVEGEPIVPDNTPPPAGGEDLLNLIDDLSGPGGGEGGGGSPSVFGQRHTSGVVATRQPEDLIDSGSPDVNQPEPIVEGPEDGQTSWMYLNGRWVKVKRNPTRTPDGVLQGVDNLQAGDRLEDLVTQRVIRIDVEKLLSGRSTENIVVRPGDIIRVPAAEGGFVYLSGQVARGGSFNLVEGLTIERLVISAGGLGSLAVPERVDFTRVLANGRQATIRINYGAIVERTQPDVYLRRDDIVNVGTNFWAFPMAVIRNGFRMTYGFGFLLDRNFGNDVFGAPPTNFRNN